MNPSDANGARFDPSKGGHYESWFLRANASRGKRAFWIRYTIFKPIDGPAFGERWAIVFDGDTIVAVRDEVALEQCHFATHGLDVSIGTSTLSTQSATGSCSHGGHTVDWDLEYSSDAQPLLLLPERLYRGGFPKAKALVPAPHAAFQGLVVVDGNPIPIEGWVGSQNHNWGSRHTDRYAWGQVASFAEDASAFLEVSTAQVDIGPVRTPWLTPVVFRHRGQEYAMNALWRTVRNRGEYGAGASGLPGDTSHPRWRFAARAGDVSVRGEIDAPATDFVALPYRNPPGGTKFCLNTKVARCVLEVTHAGQTERLTSNAAAFEILADAAPATIPLAF